jgi:hypothetical protein
MICLFHFLLGKEGFEETIHHYSIWYFFKIQNYNTQMEFCVYNYKITRDWFQWQDWWPLIIVNITPNMKLP